MGIDFFKEKDCTFAAQLKNYETTNYKKFNQELNLLWKILKK